MGTDEVQGGVGSGEVQGGAVPRPGASGEDCVGAAAHGGASSWSRGGTKEVWVSAEAHGGRSPARASPARASPARAPPARVSPELQAARPLSSLGSCSAPEPEL
ncbi:hypothetical protein [Streptomyces sp. NPDC057253]|uniref:hypothetical protein n=1 Tax=Streptomyces sp. NPDC057253 TaxID=3346069 RepID=UPI003637B101